MPDYITRKLAEFERDEEAQAIERAERRAFRSQVRQAIAEAQANQIARRLGIARKVAK